MPVDLYSFVGMYRGVLAAADHLLDKGVEHAKAQGVSEEEMLEWRLAPDMFPLRRQFQIVIDHTRIWTARAADVAVPDRIEGESSVAELKAGIAMAKAFLAGLTPDQFAGRDETPVSIQMGETERTQPLGRWVTGFGTTNVYFHLSTAYGILRSKGAPLGKRDLMTGVF